MGAALSIHARLVGACLREYREAARLDLQDAASVLGCDRSKVSVRHEAYCFIARKAGRDERRYLWV